MTSPPSWTSTAVERLPSDASPEDGMRMGCVLAEAGRYDAAAAILRRTLARHPDHVRACTHLALYLYRLDDYAEAEAVARIALGLDPNDALAHRYLGMAIGMSRTRPREALAHLDESVRLAPTDAWAHYHRAVHHTRMGRTRKALAGFAVTAEHAPLEPSLLAGAAECVLALKRPRQARAYAARAFACGMDNPAALAAEARFRLMAGQHRDAHDLVRAAVGLDAQNANALACLIEARMCRNPIHAFWSRVLNWMRGGRLRPVVAVWAVLIVVSHVTIEAANVSPVLMLAVLAVWICLLGSLVVFCQLHKRRLAATRRPVRLGKGF